MKLDMRPTSLSFSGPLLALATKHPEQAESVAELMVLASQIATGPIPLAKSALKLAMSKATELAVDTGSSGSIEQVIEGFHQLATQRQLWADDSKEPGNSLESKNSYRVRRMLEGPTLIEEPIDGTPFHVRHTDYQATVRALEEVACVSPAKFSEIYERFVALGGKDVVSKYPVRVTLRFLRSRTPALVCGKRRYYQAQNIGEGFAAEAEKAWQQLPHSDG